MTDDWNDLASAWRTDAPSPPFDFDAFQQRMDRARMRRRMGSVIGLFCCALAAIVSIAAMAGGGPGQKIAGLAGMAYTLFGLAVELGRQRTPGAMAARTVRAAVDWEIATLRSDIGYARSGLALIIGALLFLAVVTAILQVNERLEPDSSGTFAVVAGALWILGGGVHTVWMLKHRDTRRARLEALRTQLNDEAD